MSATQRHRPARPPAWPATVRIPGRERGRWRVALGGRALARWYAVTLDRELAAGASPRRDPLVARRARQLTATRSRRRLAAGLERAMRDSHSYPSGWTAVVAPDRHEVLGARVVIGALERRLRDGEPIEARGAALLQVLLTDGNGPLYAPAGPGALGSQLRAAAAALEPGAR